MKDSVVRNSDLEQLQTWLSGTRDPGHRIRGRSPLCVAVLHEARQMVHLLLSSGIDVHERDALGQTALHDCDDPEIGNMLLAAGANVNDVGRMTGNTPLHVCAERDNARMIEFLTAHGGNFDAINQEGETPLTLASRAGHLRAVTGLIDAGANVNHRGRNGWTPLMHAVGGKSKQRLKLAEAIMEAGADLEAKTVDERTALTEAAWHASPAIVQALIDAGAKLDEADEFGETALTCAIRHERPENARVLVDASANVNVRISSKHPDPARRSKTPLGLAGDKGYTDLVEQLKAAGATL